MQKKLLRRALATMVSSMIFGCGAPADLFVDGVRIEPPPNNWDPEIITISSPVSAAIDSIKLDLVHNGFVIKETDRQLGVIQTDDKILGRGEDFEREYSDGQKAAAVGGCCLAAAVVVGAVAWVVASNADTGKAVHNNRKKSNKCDNRPEEHQEHYCSQESAPAVIQKKGRLQIVAARGCDSTRSLMEVTAYLSTWQNGVKGDEEQAIRLHPFVQKYACVLAHRNCGRAPGQKIIPVDSTGWKGVN